MKTKLDITKQNTFEAIQLLSAQKKIYSQAKYIELFSFLFTLVPIILALYVKNENCIQFFTSIAVMLSLGLTQWSKCKIKLAAKIQEKFDTFVFGLAWNKILVGREPKPEIINEFSKDKDQNKSNLKNWYPTPDSKSDEINIILCQRNNVVWNMWLHKRCKYAILSFVVTSEVLVFMSIFFKNCTWTFALDAAIVATIPIVLKFINYYIGFTTLLTDETELVNKIDDIIEKVNCNGYLISSEDLRSIQDFIFVNIRSSTILVPDVVYFLTRKSQEKAMKSSTSSITNTLK